MLGMELRLSRDGSRQWARHIASGFTFTIRQCTPLDPRIGHTSAAATPGELPLFCEALMLCDVCSILPSTAIAFVAVYPLQQSLETRFTISHEPC